MRTTVKNLLKRAAERSNAIRRVALYIARETISPDGLWHAARSAFDAAGKQGEWSRCLLASYSDAAYGQQKNVFLNNASKSQYPPSVRENLINRFEMVDAKVESGTTKTDGVLL